MDAAARPNPLTLRFSRPLERDYQQYFARHHTGYAQAALTSGVIMYAALAYLDHVLAPGMTRALWTIRLGIVTPTLLAFLAFTLTPAFRRLMQPVLVFICVFTAASVDVLNVLAFEHTGNAYYFGVIIVNMYLHTFGRVQWAWAAPVGLLNVAIYQASLLLVADVSHALLVTSNSFILATLILGMVACYTIDHMQRREFLHISNLSSVNAELQRHSRTDPLTGLLNRRSMRERLEEEAARSARNGRAFSIAIADADHFKRINDRWGHACGDTVLCGLASMIRGSLRGTDVAARWGGEEFLILFADTRLAGARIAAEQLRRNVHRLNVRHENSMVPVSISLGVVEVHPGENPADALRRADEALYEGKRSGRDRTVIGAPARIANDLESEHQPGGEPEQQAHARDVGRRRDENA